MNNHSFTSSALTRVSISPKPKKSSKRSQLEKITKPQIPPYKSKMAQRVEVGSEPRSQNKSLSSSRVKSSHVVRGKTGHVKRHPSEGGVYSKVVTIIQECLEALHQGHGYNQCITKLTGVEKLAVTHLGAADRITIFIKYLRIRSYYVSQDYGRAIKNIELMTKKSLCFYKKKKLKKEIANSLMHIHKIWADTLVLTENYSKAAKVYRELIDLNSIWKDNRYSSTCEDLIPYKDHEFSPKDLLEAKSSCGEALMNSGETIRAIKRFEEAKEYYHSTLVVSSELVYINILNQVGNCYMRIQKYEKALENYELSMRIFEASKDELQISDIVMAKIQANIASIYLEKQRFVEAIRLYESSLRLKRQNFPEHHEEIELAYSNLAEAYSKGYEYAEAYSCFDQAYEISKNLYGKHHKAPARYILNCARMKFKLEEYEDSTKLFEYAAKLYQYLEEGIGKQGRAILLKLVEISQVQHNDEKAGVYLSQLLSSLDSCRSSSEKVNYLNDLGNIQKRGGQLYMAIELYKKAIELSTRSIRGKCFEKSKSTILTNLADTYCAVSNYHNACKYYKHALKMLDEALPMADLGYAKTMLKLAKAQKYYESQSGPTKSQNKVISPNKKKQRGYCDEAQDSEQILKQAMAIIQNLPPSPAQEALLRCAIEEF
ncbi:unnamed protein product [Moneuplotes crassus]|uniref:Uncharacterized protein n=1 Tax=Euplotes crassus TaxID=5936 RepID=A0AAD1U522_EUPCR|nr:unnamed protein product [Moneuplotes crassus]